jgi:SAM-dependent MidA family methyltransferase
MCSVLVDFLRCMNFDSRYSQVVAQFGGNSLAGVHLVETSAALRALQDTRLSPSAVKYGCTFEWHDSLDQIPPTDEEYTMVLAHEFFDALPFHTIEVLLLGFFSSHAAINRVLENRKRLARTSHRFGGEQRLAPGIG